MLQVSSSGYEGGNFAKIVLNDFNVEIARNENHHFRGLHVVIFDPQAGTVVLAKAFDTYKTSEEFELHIVKEFPPGLIVAAACMDECITNLSEKAKQWFEDLGSKEIRNLEYRCGFALIGITGQKAVHERRAVSKRDEVSVS